MQINAYAEEEICGIILLSCLFSPPSPSSLYHLEQNVEVMHLEGQSWRIFCHLPFSLSLSLSHTDIQTNIHTHRHTNTHTHTSYVMYRSFVSVSLSLSVSQSVSLSLYLSPTLPLFNHLTLFLFYFSWIIKTKLELRLGGFIFFSLILF